MKIIILVLSKKDNGVYHQLENKIRKTWQTNNDVIKTFYYYGDSDHFKVIGDEIYTENIDILENIGYKTIDSFKYIYQNLEFDYIYRTNSSSYINIDGLINFIKDKPRDNFYAARVNFEKHSGQKFGSGSGYFLSKDLVNFIIKNEKKWNHKLIDDVALGDLLLSNGFQLTPSYRLDIDDIIDGYPFSNGKRINLEDFKNFFHFRCKSKDINRLKDIKIMDFIHNYFNG